MSEEKHGTFTVSDATVAKTDVGRYGNDVVHATFTLDGKSVEAEFMKKPDTPLPADGDELTGTISQTQYGLKFKRDSMYANNGGGNGAANGGDRTEAIERAVAIKSATELVSARIMAGELKGQEAAQAALEAMTLDIINLVKGDQKKKEEGKAPAAAPATDTDIPF